MQLSRQHLVLVGLVIISLLGLTWYANSTPTQKLSPDEIASQKEEEARKARYDADYDKYQNCLIQYKGGSKTFGEDQRKAYECFTSGTGNLTPVSEVPIQGIITKVSAAELTTVTSAVASEPKQVKSEKLSPSTSPKSTPAQTVAPSSHIENLTKNGYREEPTMALIIACSNARDPLHCKLYGLSIMYNESGNQQNSKACVTRKNCMGLNSGKMVFKSYQDGMDDWVRRYNKYWYKATSISQFYAPIGKKSYYRYCTSEDSSNSEVGCPEGLKITSAKFSQISLIFKK